MNSSFRGHRVREHEVAVDAAENTIAARTSALDEVGRDGP